MIRTDNVNDQFIFKDKIITTDIEQCNVLYYLPTYIKLKKVQNGEPPYMKLRTEVVLRYHKFNRSKNFHEHLFSEFQLYYPHTNGRKNCLAEEKKDFDVCKMTYEKSNIANVKKIIMPFLESVMENMETAHSLKSTIGDELDPQKEQDETECKDMGIENNPEFAVKDFDDLENEALSEPGLFKKVIVKPDEELFPLIHRMDKDQRMVVDVTLRYIKRIFISKKRPMKFAAPRLIVQGGAGAGKSAVIHVVVQLMEKFLRMPGDNLDKPYVLPLSFTGTAAANIDGMTLHSAFNFPFSNEFLSLPDKLRDQKRDYLKNLKMIVIDEFSMIKSDLLHQIDLRLRELLERTDQPFGGCAVCLAMFYNYDRLWENTFLKFPVLLTIMHLFI